jgi:transglutaminase-like putative cysteine protease
MRVAVTHRTTYRYAQPVTLGEHRLMTRPRDSHDMRLIAATLTTTPPATLRWKHDVFGNSIGLATFEAPSEVLEIISEIVLEHFPGAPREIAEQIEPYARTLPFAYPADEVGDLGRTTERHFADPDHRVDAWAKEMLAEFGPETGKFLAGLTLAIKERFRYAARDAEGTNNPLETLERGDGACRDFALLMMEAVRSLGLAARFVSGYLYDSKLADSDEPVVGGGATHAWCDVYVPGAGWVEFDPTNGLIGGRNLIRVATVRAPEQAIPIAGGYTGTPQDFLGLEVDVQVAVGEQAAAPGEAQPPAPAPVAEPVAAPAA